MRAPAAIVAVLAVHGCLLLDPLDDVALSTSTTAGTGGNTGGSGGSGGAPDCDTPTPGACEADAVLPIAGDGAIEILDAATDGNSGNLVMIGRFSGRVLLPGNEQLDAGQSLRAVVFDVEPASRDTVRVRDLGPIAATDRWWIELTPGGDVVVGGSYTENGPEGCDGTAAGLFAWRLTAMGATYDEVYLSCRDVRGTASAHDVSVSEAEYVQVVGSFEGTMDGVASDGVDGFVVSFDPVGVPIAPPIAFAGSGEAVVRAVVPNASNETLVAGDFTLDMNVDIAPNKMASRTAQGDRDMFVATVDDFAGDPNLVLVALGSGPGARRVTVMHRNPADAARILLAGTTSGALDVVGTNISPPPSATAFVLDLVAPLDSAPGVALEYQGHTLLSAEAISLDHVVGTQLEGAYHLAGLAAGDISVTEGSAMPTLIPATGCQLDAFVIRIGGGAAGAQRCGDGSQTIAGLSPVFDPDRAAVIVNVADGGSLDGDGTGPSAPAMGSDAFILLPAP